MVPHIIQEFCWFLELHKEKNYAILLNGNPLNYETNIAERTDQVIVYQENEEDEEDEEREVFTVRYIQWKKLFKNELSKYYFLDETQNEVYKEHTRYNLKGDDFYHSIYIESSFFTDFNFSTKKHATQLDLFEKNNSRKVYTDLMAELESYLYAKRKAYIKKDSSKLINKYDKENIFPEYKNEWEEKYKRPQLEKLIQGMYTVQPSIFTNQNLDQKKIFVRLLDLLLDTNEQENLFRILDEVVKLSTDERKELADLFQTTRLNRITQTIKMIEERYRVCEQLKELVFHKELKANERNHLQKMIENHFWLLGEHYNLVAADQTFKTALHQHRQLLGHVPEQENTDAILDNNRMDLLICRKQWGSGTHIENVLVEIKHPAVKIGMKEYQQIHTYLKKVLSIPEFNDTNNSWEFYLIGNTFDEFIEGQIESHKAQRIDSLIYHLQDGRIKVYVKTWAEIFTAFESRHTFLNQQLHIERSELLRKGQSADQLVADSMRSPIGQQ